MKRIENRLKKLETQTQPRAVQIVVIEDENWYRNDAHRLAREAGRNAAGADRYTVAVEGWYGNGVAKEEGHDDQEPNPQA